MKYIPHDVDAATDPKCDILIDECGMEGYGRFWRLVELMARSSHGFVDLAARGQRTMTARALRMEPDGLDAFLGFLADIGLVDAEALERDHVTSDAFLRRREASMAAYESGKQGGRPPKKGRSKG